VSVELERIWDKSVVATNSVIGNHVQMLLRLSEEDGAIT
jgi:hypothetical protein